MIKLTSIIILLFNVFTVCAIGRYTFRDRNIVVTVEWTKAAFNSDSITIRLTPINDILIPDDERCFEYQEFDSLFYFNMYCGVKIDGKVIYPLSQGFPNRFRPFSCDSTLTYTWHEINNKKCNGFCLDIMYIPTNTKQYAELKKRFLKIPLSSGGGMYISDKDESALISRAYLRIVNE